MQSLTQRADTLVGGILTVADDLLKNDGKKFIEMMEQLAERRMQREEEQQYAAAGLGPGHNHDPSQDDDGYEEEDDDEYDSQEDEDYEEDDEMVGSSMSLQCLRSLSSGTADRKATDGRRP